jgi:hypothetical protein
MSKENEVPIAAVYEQHPLQTGLIHTGAAKVEYARQAAARK